MSPSSATWLRLLALVGLVVGLSGARGLAKQPPPEARGFPSIRSFSPREYRSHNQIWTARPGPDGVMYFGTSNEVLTFDGLTWRTVPVPGAAFMRAMAIDQAGTVWVGGVDEIGRLVHNADGELTFESLRPHLPESVREAGDFRRIVARPDGVYFQSDAYLLRWHDETFSVWEMHEPYIALLTPWEDRLIVCREAGWMMPTTANEWEPVPGQPDPALFMLLSDLVPDGHGAWLIAGGRHGLWHFDGQSSKPVEGPTAELLQRSRLFGVSRMPDGRLLFPTLGYGLLITDAELNPLAHLTAENGLPSNTVICVTPISPSEVWVGTEQGVAHLDLSPGFSRFSPFNGLEKNGANTVIRANGDPLFATTLGPLTLRDGPTFGANPDFHAGWEINDKLNTFHALPQGGILTGGLQAMWWIDEAETVHRLHSPSNISSILVHPSFPDHVFALHLTGIALWRRDGDEWTDHRPIEGPRGEFQSLCADDAGNLWFGSANAGVGRLPYGTLEPGANLWDLPDPELILYDESDGLPPIKNRMVVREIEGEPLFMSSFGLFRYDSNRNRFVPETSYGDKLADGTWCSHLAANSPLGGVWFEVKPGLPAPENAFRQIGKFKDDTWRPLPIPNLEQIGGLQDLVCEIIDGEEILWLCGAEGVIRVNVTQATASPPSPVGPTIFQNITTAAETILPFDFASDAPLAINARDNSLRFHFGTPGLAGEIDAEHRSRLIGFVDGKLEANNSGERTFTNLPAGKYIFEVSGRTADHRWSKPARAEFIVLAPWWLTPGAKVAYALTVVVLVYLIVRWRTRRLERLRTELEATVATRTAELAQKAAALERLHQLERDETLAARLATETARLELLRYQLNPHFLFNSLNSIRALVYRTPDAAGEMVSKLADFCRRTLSRGGDEMVTLTDELEMARNYLDIEQVRWQDGLHINFDIAEPAQCCQLPQNLLLPLLENGIKYGGRTSPDLLRINIQARLKDGTLTVEISNTGKWVKPDTNPFADSTQIGLQNLRQRLNRHYGTAAALTHDDSVTGWVTVKITLPCSPPESPAP